MVILRMTNNETLNNCMMFLNKNMMVIGVMFLIKYAKYLMHNHPFSSLTSAHMDWFQEKMTIELFYFKILPT
ncbi:hypothetical protein CK203_040095 [Vitis vinifera]|uniref:Uncharacterized protein n=1 Tax=Vitis vinifera TaxID=29760 RepID=A0A438IDY6_VITVI|nr:hypothetical protein CK203_040095 [Vitis vinifera]